MNQCQGEFSGNLRRLKPKKKPQPKRPPPPPPKVEPKTDVIVNTKKNEYVEEIYKIKKQCANFLLHSMNNNNKIDHVIKVNFEKIINGEYMRHPSFTNRTKYFKKTIDYIFFSNNLQLRKILKLPRDYEVDKEKFLPILHFNM